MFKSLLLPCTLSIVAVGCSQLPGTSSGSSSSAPAATGTAPAPLAAPAAKPGPRQGLTATGEVTDPTKVTCGDGPKIKGMNDTEGEILGKPAPGTKFNQLKIGMGMKQVTDLVGQPTDQGAYVTGKAFIPFYFGGDRHRFEMAYKGWGRLIFAGGNLGNLSGGNLICVIHYSADTGYR